MRENAHDPKSVTLSVRIYRRMIAAYPYNFRRDYAEPMLQVFRDCCRKAYLDGGALALPIVWARTGLDYLKTLVDEYARGGMNMTREKFIKLSGWALMLAAIALISGFSVAGGETAYEDPLGGSDGFYEYGQLILIPASLFLYTIGVGGMLARYGSASGGLGKMGLVVATIGAALSFLGSIPLYALLAQWMGPWWNIMIYSLMGMLIGLSLFGVAALRTKPLGKWNALPLLTAIWFPLLFLIAGSLGYLGNDTTGIEDYMALVALIFMIAGSIGLGYILQKDIPAYPGNPVQA